MFKYLFDHFFIGVYMGDQKRECSYLGFEIQSSVGGSTFIGKNSSNRNLRQRAGKRS